MMDLPADIVALIADQLDGDHQSLSNLTLTCRAWRAVYFPRLLKDVDLSSHNLGRQPEHDCDLLGFEAVEADYADRFRPHDKLVPRQRAFLRLMTERPELASYVRSLTWTLIWYDFDEDCLTDIDRQTWNVFQRFTNVTHLDLASLHQIAGEPYIRQNPDHLFPGVVNLRLVGWMHRGLVRAIVCSLGVNKLRCLTTDHLQDEGALPGGRPMMDDLARSVALSLHHRCEGEAHDDDMKDREESGKAAILPGPMWLPFRILRRRTLTSLRSLDVRLPYLDSETDVRNYHTLFAELNNFLQSVHRTLQKLSIAQGENPRLYSDDRKFSGCGTSRVFIRGTYCSWCFDMTTLLLRGVLAALTEKNWPRLTHVELKGFRIIEDGRSRFPAPPDFASIWKMINDCPFLDVSSLCRANLDGRQPWVGYESSLTTAELEELQCTLRNV